MESENVVEPEEIHQITEEAQREDAHPRETTSSNGTAMDWKMWKKSLDAQYNQIVYTGSAYMRREEINRVVYITSQCPMERDPYVEMYYSNKVHEKDKDSRNNSGRKMRQFLEYSQKEEIAKRHAEKEVKAKIFQRVSGSLGKPVVHNSRLPTARLDIGMIDKDEDASADGAHLKVLSSIEAGYSSLMKMEMLSKQLEECDNEFKRVYITLEQKKAQKTHLGAFFMELKEDETVDVKPRWLILVMKSRKGKKLFLRSYPFFTREIWLQFLSYLIPYILIWCDDESNKDVDTLVLQMIIEYLNSPFVDLAFITSIMEMFVKQKCVKFLPGLLKEDMYAGLIETLFQRGEELLTELKEKDEKHEMEEVIIRWTNVMELIEESIPVDEDM